MPKSDFLQIIELRPGVLRFWDSYWVHDCDDFDLVAMTHRHGRQGGVDSEDPADWVYWTESRIRVIEDRVERRLSADEWASTRAELLERLEALRSTQRIALHAPHLAVHADLNRATKALQAHDQTTPGWISVPAVFNDAILAYVRDRKIEITNPEPGD